MIGDPVKSWKIPALFLLSGWFLTGIASQLILRGYYKCTFWISCGINNQYWNVKYYKSNFSLISNFSVWFLIVFHGLEKQTRYFQVYLWCLIEFWLMIEIFFLKYTKWNQNVIFNQKLIFNGFLHRQNHNCLWILSGCM